MNAGQSDWKVVHLTSYIRAGPYGYQDGQSAWTDVKAKYSLLLIT